MRAVPLRKLKARAIMKDLSIRQISKLAGVPYSTVSQILNGNWIHPEYLERIEKVINQAPNPR